MSKMSFLLMLSALAVPSFSFAKGPFPTCPSGSYLLVVYTAPAQGQQIVDQLIKAGVVFPVVPGLPPNPGFHNAMTVGTAEAKTSEAVKALQDLYTYPNVGLECEQPLHINQ